MLFLIIGYVVAIIFFVLITKCLWNILMPSLFNTKEITFFQTIGLLILVNIFFKSCDTSYIFLSKSK